MAKKISLARYLIETKWKTSHRKIDGETGISGFTKFIFKNLIEEESEEKSYQFLRKLRDEYKEFIK